MKVRYKNMKLKSNKQSLDELKKYSIAFSPKNIDKVKSRLHSDNIDYIEVFNILDIVDRVMDGEVAIVYMYDRGDLILNEEFMDKSAVKLFEYVLHNSGVVLLFVKEMI